GWEAGGGGGGGWDAVVGRGRRSVCVFFFQAEDGIRDRTVTGVQTCALPICSSRRGPAADRARSRPGGCLSRAPPLPPAPARSSRSEERRVGKECSSRPPPPPSTKNPNTHPTTPPTPRNPPTPPDPTPRLPLP